MNRNTAKPASDERFHKPARNDLRSAFSCAARSYRLAWITLVGSIVLCGALPCPALAQATQNTSMRQAALDWIELVGGSVVTNEETGELAVTLVENRELMGFTPLVMLPEITELTLASEIEIDLNTLVGLPRLRVLNLRMPNTKFTPLAGLAGLESLKLEILRDYQINNDPNIAVQPLELTPLVGLTELRALQIHSENRPVSLASLEQLHRLELLEVTGAPIDSIDGLAGMRSLQEAKLRLSHEVVNLAPMAGMINLQKLELEILRDYDRHVFQEIEEPVIDFAPLAELANLRELWINAGGRTIDLGPLNCLSQLERLDLSGTQIDSIAFLAGMTGLTEAQLQLNNAVTTLDPLAGLAEMQVLWICGHGVRDASALSELNKLERVFIQLSREYSDLSCFAELPHLRDLDITACYGCSDLTPLVGLAQLEQLTLVLCTGVTDISPLAEMEQLKTLDLRAANVSNLEPISDLQQNGLNVIQ